MKSTSLWTVLWMRTHHGSLLYAPNRWETTLHRNVVSHWLGAFRNGLTRQVVFHDRENKHVFCFVLFLRTNRGEWWHGCDFGETSQFLSDRFQNTLIPRTLLLIWLNCNLSRHSSQLHLIDTIGAHFTNDFSIEIQIRYKFHAGLTQVIAAKFCPTAEVSWHVQNFVAIWYPAMELH